MNESQVILIIITVIGSVFSFYIKIRKDIQTEEINKREPMKALNESIIQLNSTIGFLTQMIDNLKERVSTHGQEIHDLELQNQSHEERIKLLEKSYFDSFK